MGALSSWAMLAVTHHMIVQLAARRAGAGFTYDFIRKRAWFEGYELLGDDLVIFSSKVAHQYLLIMEAIGVPINRSKSVVARNGSFEFAKVTGYLGYNVSAISWRMFISQNTHMGRVNIAYSFFRKGMCNVKRPMLLIRTIVRRNFKDFGDLGYSYIALMTMMSKLGIVRYEDLYNTIFSGAKKLNRY